MIQTALPILTLRKAVPTDYFTLWQLRNDVTVRRALNHRAISFFDFIKEVESSSQIYLAGVVGESVAGYAQLSVFSAKVVGVFVAIFQSERQRGFGTQLCNSAYLWATANGYERVIASVDKNNPAGLALANKCGFKFEGSAPGKGELKNLYARS